MNRDDIDDTTINAYIDGQLDSDESVRVYDAVSKCSELKAYVCELQHVKQSVIYAFQGVKPPEHTPQRARSGRGRTLSIAAGVVVILFTGVIAGWLGHNWHSRPITGISLANVETDPQKLILLIGDADRSKYVQTLDQAEELLLKHQSDSTQLEIVVNAGGLDLLRVDTSPYVERIVEMMEKYSNLHFVACTNSISSLEYAGIGVTLIDGTEHDQPAIDHVIERLREGWTYVRI